MRRRTTRHDLSIIAAAVCLLCGAAAVRADGGALADNDIMMKALVEELTRSMEHLVLDDLPRPYFIQYAAEERLTFTMQASYGGLVQSNRQHLRAATSRVRVGSYELDNTNIGRGFGGRALLPLDDDLTALRHAIWTMTDGDYKQAVEFLTRKTAYLEQKNIEDRPDDFTKAEAVKAIEPSAEIAFDEKAWKAKLESLSARFKDHPAIQDADVSFFAGAANGWIVNSEGTRLRTGDAGAYVRINARIQADDGMELGDGIAYLALSVDTLPSADKMLTDIDELCRNLIALSKAPVLDHYTGPILFEPAAAAATVASVLSDELCARPTPLGAGAWTDSGLENRIGQRILPRSFNVYDDPKEETYEGTVLAGSYTFDDEGVAPQRVSLVEKGILKAMLAGRAPTKKVTGTNGHSRGPGFTDPEANIGCLFVEDAAGLSNDELKAELVQAAADEGLEFALRVASVQDGGYGELGDPIRAYKVYVADGREELIRGLTFESIETRSLKRILAGGTTRKVYNSLSGVTKSVISPALLFEELELNKTEEEFDKLPILASPFTRKP